MVSYYLCTIDTSLGGCSCKKFNVFYHNYGQGLGLTSVQFSYIMISQYIGWITAMFVAPLNDKYLKSSRMISMVHVLLDGIFASLFILPVFIDNNLFKTKFNNYETVIYCSIIWFLFGNVYPMNKLQ